MKKILFALCFMGLLFQSCKKDEDTGMTSDSDFLIFGHFYGLCSGEDCVEIFKLDESQLLEDSEDNYPDSDVFNTLNFSIDQADKRTLVEDLLDKIPDELLQTSEKVIGSPDAGDWGGVYIEVNLNGQHDFWLLDMAEDNLPNEELKTFRAEVVEAIDLINN